MSERGSRGRWVSRIIALVVLMVFFLVMKMMATQLERMVEVERGEVERPRDETKRDGDVPDLPRIALRYNLTMVGRLRELIDALNERVPL